MSLALPAHLAGGGDYSPPAEFADAVETYARQNGRHGTLKFVPPINCWIVEFTLRANDPRMEAWKTGKAAEPPKEVTYLWRYDQKAKHHTPRKGVIEGMYVGYKLDELGVTGLIEFLDRGNTNKQAETLEQSVKKQADAQESAQDKIRRDRRDDARHRGMLDRRQALDIPILPVGIDLKAPTTAPEDT